MDRFKPTTQMLGRFQPWHQGHTALFERALAKTGQVAILLRDTEVDEKNPFTVEERKTQIISALAEDGYEVNLHFTVIAVPNITHITYGRDVGYTIEQEFLGDEIESISATKIRENMTQ